ncbi:MAG: HEAT repeat domain-containing protein [Actinomycetota bacterium]|nr:HEAT repeat domain-containing protein [Actinomycetota bacterium]
MPRLVFPANTHSLNRDPSTDRIGRYAAARHLGDMQSREAVEPLLSRLQARDEFLRNSAVIALRKIGDRRVLAAVFEVATEDSSFRVRTNAMETLGALGDRRAVGLIGSTLSKAEIPFLYRRWYRKWASAELVKLEGIEAIGDLRRARRGAGPIGRWRLWRAIRTLKKLERKRKAGKTDDGSPL